MTAFLCSCSARDEVPPSPPPFSVSRQMQREQGTRRQRTGISFCVAAISTERPSRFLLRSRAQKGQAEKAYVPTYRATPAHLCERVAHPITAVVVRGVTWERKEKRIEKTGRQKKGQDKEGGSAPCCLWRGIRGDAGGDQEKPQQGRR